MSASASLPLSEAVGRYDAILLAVPSQHLRAAARMLAPALAAGTPVIACAKGIERGTHKFMTEVIAESAPNALPAILSGPSFAADVARGLPAAVTLAARDDDVAAALRARSARRRSGSITPTTCAASRSAARPRTCSRSPPASSPGGGLGASAAAALITRGFAELFRFGRAFGARPETLTGLSGLGDLILSLLERAVAQLFLRSCARQRPDRASRRG